MPELSKELDIPDKLIKLFNDNEWSWTIDKIQILTRFIETREVVARVDEHNLLLDKELDLSQEAFFVWADEHYKELKDRLAQLKQGSE